MQLAQIALERISANFNLAAEDFTKAYERGKELILEEVIAALLGDM